MWARKRIDIDAGSILYGLLRCALPGAAQSHRETIAGLLPREDHALICLSVRTGFDLLLTALRLPEGSEILMTSLTIPDMPEIVRAHGLVPVPLDLELETAGPDPDLVEASITSRTRAIVVAHLFGSELDLTRILEICRKRGVFVIEDSAQAFHSTDRWGHPGADASMFSFGTIKTSTALGGAVIRLGDARLFHRMVEERETFPRSSRSRFLRRLLKTVGLKVLSQRLVYGWLYGTCRTLGVDVDRLVGGLARGFPGEHLLPQIRKRMDRSQLALLGHRLRVFDRGSIERRRDAGRFLKELLSERVTCPGAESGHHTYWVFPILSSEPEETIAALRQAGFDASSRQSMEVISPPESRPEAIPAQVRALYESMVYLPLDPEMDEGTIREMAAVVLRSEVSTVGA